MEDEILWVLVIATIVSFALIAFGVVLLWQTRPRRHETARSASETSRIFAEAVVVASGMPAGGDKDTVQRVLLAVRNLLDQLVPLPAPTGPTLDHWD